jgi:hypothetical protein
LKRELFQSTFDTRTQSTGALLNVLALSSNAQRSTTA